MGIEICGRRHNLEINQKMFKINHATFAIMGDIHGQWDKLAYVLEKLESISIFILVVYIYIALNFDLGSSLKYL